VTHVQEPRTGFTLIELLVVIAVLSILLAILTPVTQRALEYAKEASCQSNLRQIGMGTVSYATDEGYLPTSYEYRNQPYVVAVWPALVRSSGGVSEGTFYCPTAPEAARWTPTFGSGMPAEHGYAADEVRLRAGGSGSWPFSYGHNNGGTRDGSRPQLGMGDPWNPSRFSSMVAPASFIMYADAMINGRWDHFIDEDIPGEEPTVRHRGGAFFVFGDMHVEYLIPGPYLDHGNTGANNPDFRRRWNLDNQPH